MWNPQFKVIDTRFLGQNILDYIETNQEDALTWANGGAGLDPFAKFYTNASGRLQTIFPSLMILAQTNETDLTGDQLQADFDLVLEGTVTGSDPDDLVANTKKYAMAVESMLLNITSDELTEDSNQYHKGFSLEIETVFDILRGQVTPSAFTQIFNTRVKYRLITSGV